MKRLAATVMTALLAVSIAAFAEPVVPSGGGKSTKVRAKRVYQPARPPAVEPMPESGPLLHSSAAMVFDQSARTPVYEKNEGRVMPIASLTKLMTAMVVLDAGLPLDEPITVSAEDVDTLKNSSSRLRVGLSLPRREMLRLALMSSENRAASSLGRHYPGGIEAFVQQMNVKAALLGMGRSRFVDSTGLNSDNVSTAGDLVRMVEAAQNYPLIREFTTTEAHEVQPDGSRYALRFRNSNQLVASEDWRIGLSKTGYIREAGRCLVLQARIADRPFVIVLLDSWGKLSRIGDANRIKRWLESHIASSGTGIKLAER